MKKRVLSVVFAMAMVLNAAGCTSKNPANTTTSEIATTVSETEPVTTTVATTTKATTTTKVTTTKVVTTTKATTVDLVKQRKEEVVDILKKEYTSKLKAAVEYEPKDHSGENHLVGGTGRYKVYLKIKPSFEGDTYLVGIYDSYTDKYVLPFTKDSKLLTDDKANVAKIYENRDSFFGSGSDFYYVDENVISYSGYGDKWYYDIEKDVVLYVNDEHANAVKVHNDNVIVYYHYNGNGNERITHYNINTQEEKTIIDGGYCKKALDDCMVVLYTKNNDYYKICDYNGKELINLKEYNIDYRIDDYMISDGEKALAIVAGEDSGYYVCLIDSNGELINEPNMFSDDEFEQLEREYDDISLLLFDDFYAIVYINDAGMDTRSMKFDLYEFDGTFITDFNYKYQYE